jgi:serine/threonine protein phosphatase 1
MDANECDHFNIFVSDWEPAPGWLDSGTVVCAVGDVHGQFGHLTALVNWIRANALADRHQSNHLIMLGDYIDRGPKSIGCLAYLGRLELPGVAVICLRGNHDHYLERILFDPNYDFDLIDEWVGNGGDSTLNELGLQREDLYRLELDGLRERLLTQMPGAALDCLTGLRSSTRLDGYLFVHAGVHPEGPFDAEDIKALLWIREPFLSGEGWSHDFVAVHGHAIRGPDVKRHRIACDSGAYRTNILTCAQFKDRSVRFIAATPAPDLFGLERVPNRRLSSATERWTRVQ